MLLVAFVPDYRCGTAPDLHWIPFYLQQSELLQTEISTYMVVCLNVNTKYSVLSKYFAHRPLWQILFVSGFFYCYFPLIYL